MIIILFFMFLIILIKYIIDNINNKKEYDLLKIIKIIYWILKII